jgi:hypothetical protein
LIGVSNFVFFVMGVLPADLGLCFMGKLLFHVCVFGFSSCRCLSDIRCVVGRCRWPCAALSSIGPGQKTCNLSMDIAR